MMSTPPSLPRYRRIALAMADRLRRGEYPAGTLLPSQARLADEFGVTRVTMRRAIGLLEAEGKLEGHQGLGTMVTDSTAGSANLVFIGEAESHVHKDQFIELMQAARRQGHRLHSIAVSDTTPLDERELRFEARQADGIILSSHCYLKVANTLGESELPLTAIGWPRGYDPGPSLAVYYDVAAGVRMAVEHLAARGHRRIGLLTHTDRRYNRCFEAYVGTCARLGLDDTTCIENTGDNRPEEIERIAACLTDPQIRPTAIVADSDSRCGWLYQAAAQLGLTIPDDISVVGMGNTPWSEHYHPALTSVAYPLATAADLVIRLAVQPLSSPTELSITPKLIARESVADPR